MDASFQETMESLQLPKELYWDLKLEPQSPTAALGSDLLSFTDSVDAEWLCDDNFANGISLIGDEEALILNEAASLELLSDEELVVEIFDMKDEECLLDQKAAVNCIDYERNSYQPIIDVVSQPIIPVNKVPFASSSVAASLVSSADYQLGDPPSLVLQQLTPPQSPPQFDAYKQPEESLQLLPVKAEQKVQCYTPDATSAAAATPFNFNNWVGGSEIARENQLVDDIVNMRAKELELTTNWPQFNEDCESQASSSLDSRSTGSGVNGSIADADEDWLPEATSSCSSPAHTAVEQSAAKPKKRTRTYGRGVEDRKIRKKEQNKNAATRYRQKKKLEMESVLGEEHVLSQENEELRRTLQERRNEMRYLRQLIREFYQERKR
ncbi:activating transcription factor of chaperone isoform X1 [Drosophila biarmipes]|uniref:activating transcription factor of chaperone isoform X1 n=1 Tax=Drosophila biarmipes TaxID=125945 RepID=UPI0007E63F79|nr:activating transcription factor of chaperone isoform X1 [Drosophila biarmipes]